MIIPISHEDMRGRRWPVITAGIIVLNVLIFFLSMGPIERGQAAYAEKVREAAMFYFQHTYLKPSPPLDVLLKQMDRKTARTADAITMLRESANEGAGGGSESDHATEQAELDRLCVEARDAQRRSPVMRYGYVPAERNKIGLLTSQFLHGGLLHLIGNMLFLWLCGCNMEDRWGRALFPAFYLSAGVVAALSHQAAAPHSVIPMIGASGAIAGAMGAFLMRFAKTRIRFVWIFFFRAKTFSAPAYLMLPLWLLVQLFYGLMASGLAIEGGVAFWAHVGGFVYGVLFAVAIGASGLEQKIDRAIESEISLAQAPEILQAQELMEAGKALEAIDLLEKFALQQPSNIDAQLELLRASKTAQDRDREKRAYNRLIGLYMQQNAPDTAMDLYDEAAACGLDTDVPAAMRLRLARLIERKGNTDRAATELVNIYSNGRPDATSFQALLAHAQITLKLGLRDDAIRLFTMAQNSPVPHLDYDATIAHCLKQAEALGSSQPRAASGS